MDIASVRPMKSTIDRSYSPPERREKLSSPRVAGYPRPWLRALTGIVNWTRDPLGLGAELAHWTLDENEIHADLEHGRD